MVATIKDIAKAAKVSNPAVSAVLNNKTNCRVSPATRERILRFAREMDYKPNFNGLLLRGERTKTVALLISSAWQKSEEFMKDMIISLMSQFDQQGYACYLADITGDAGTNYSKVLELISRGVHHFIFMGHPVGRDQIRELIESRNKSYIVYANPGFLNRNVESDSASGAASIIRFFLSRGKDNFRLIINPHRGDRPEMNNRICGLMSVFPDIDVETLEQRYVIQMDEKIYIAAPKLMDYFVKIGYETTAMLLDDNPGIQAILYLSDFLAIGGAKLLLERGIVIGRDILLAGFNETAAVRNYPYPISSVEHDIEKTIEVIIRESLEGNAPLDILIPPIVHIREYIQ
ncbi:MAG: LacI family DNA-binding transcriptional regulator [Victivallaceae bacterium]|jgi:LacI family transcriptional regulator